MKKVVLGLMLGVITFVVLGLGYADDLVASKGGDSYHLATCAVVKNIKADNKVNIKTSEEAIKAGYKACKKCNPPQRSAAPQAFVGSKGFDKFHKSDCRLAKNIKAGNMVSFASKEDAEKANYKPCAICFPLAKKEATKATAEIKK